MFSRIAQVIFILLTLINAQSYTGPEDPNVKVELVLNVPCNGVSTTPSGRLFLVYARVDHSEGPQVVEYFRKTNTTKAYPNLEWNSYKGGDNPATHFLGVNAQRIHDGHMYIVDKGATGFGKPVNLPYGPKVVVVNLSTNNVSRVYHLGSVVTKSSLLDDIRFNPAAGKAYLTDAGDPGLVVLDLRSGDAVRVLNHAASTTGYFPMSAEGQIMYMDNKPFFFQADQHEVSPDGKYYYFQPASGGFRRIETKYMDEAFTNSSFDKNSILQRYVLPFAFTPPTGGTAIDADGNIYNSDVDSQRIIKIAPNGTMTILAQDPRLLWVDAMWIDDAGKLWMPADQLNRGYPWHNGVSEIKKPLYVFSIEIGIGPSPIDHA